MDKKVYKGFLFNKKEIFENKEECEVAPLLCLPFDLLLQIFKLGDFSVVDILQLATTCKRLNTILLQNIQTWIYLLQRYFPSYLEILIQMKSNGSSDAINTSTTFEFWRKKFFKKYEILNNWRHLKNQAWKLNLHSAGVSCLQFGEEYLISGSADRTMKVIKLISKKELHTLKVGHGITCLQMNEKLQIVVCGCIDGSIQLWNFLTCQLMLSYEGHTREIYCLQFDDSILVSASVDAKVFDLHQGKRLFHLTGHTGGVSCIQIEKQVIFTGSKDSTIRIWDRNGGRCMYILKGHTGFVYCLKFDGLRVFSGASDYQVRCWNLENVQLNSSFSSSSPISISSDKIFGTHHGSVFCIDQCKGLLISGSTSLDNTICGWNLSGDKIFSKALPRGIEYFCYIEDMKMIVCTCEKSILSFDPFSSKEASELISYSMMISCLQANEDLVISGSQDGTISIIEFSNKYHKRKYSLKSLLTKFKDKK